MRISSAGVALSELCEWHERQKVRTGESVFGAPHASYFVQVDIFAEVGQYWMLLCAAGCCRSLEMCSTSDACSAGRKTIERVAHCATALSKADASELWDGFFFIRLRSQFLLELIEQGTVAFRLDRQIFAAIRTKQRK